MNLETENGTNGMMAAFVVGSLAGGIAALLLAPSSGRRLRRTLSRSGRRLGRRTVDSAAEIHERAEEALEQASESLQAISEGARHMARLEEGR